LLGALRASDRSHIEQTLKLLEANPALLTVIIAEDASQPPFRKIGRQWVAGANQAAVGGAFTNFQLGNVTTPGIIPSPPNANTILVVDRIDYQSTAPLDFGVGDGLVFATNLPSASGNSVNATYTEGPMTGIGQSAGGPTGNRKRQARAIFDFAASDAAAITTHAPGYQHLGTLPALAAVANPVTGPAFTVKMGLVLFPGEAAVWGALIVNTPVTLTVWGREWDLTDPAILDLLRQEA
jgi:hypothetical protein